MMIMYLIACVCGSGSGLGSSGMCKIQHNQTFGVTFTWGFRPVFKLKPGIKVTGGSGTSSSPYTLGT